jgi:hypothetical protein
VPGVCTVTQALAYAAHGTGIRVPNILHLYKCALYLCAIVLVQYVMGAKCNKQAY